MTPNTPLALPKIYTPQDVESKIYERWEKGNCFAPRASSAKQNKPFVISLPPPNATGTLHLGHAMVLAVEDLMIRYHRLKGDETLWVPGTDHAAIATQNVVEKKIWKEEKKTRHDLGREELLNRIEQFVTGSRNTIKSQMRRMGASLDWSRERYTLDEGLSRVVRMVFKILYDDDLIYRGHRVVNWCTRCQTTLADDEVEHRETTAPLYTFRYSTDFPIPIASTRPETKLGDTAVAVHPDDERYTKFVGQTFTVPFASKELTVRVVADAVIDREFGTGAVGVTPAHSQTDAEIAERHKLGAIKIIDEDGKMTTEAGDEFCGLTIAETRTKVVTWLRANRLIEKEETAPQNLTVCYRCETPVEPLTSKQWFVAVNKPCTRLGGKTLRQQAREAVANGEIAVIPDRFAKIYLHWMDGLRDWCISRQIWFGHRVPVWYRHEVKIQKAKGESESPAFAKATADRQNSKLNDSEYEIYVGVEPPTGDGWKQDPDTLDTWFSSGMWTFSTLLKQDSAATTLETWRAESPDIKRYHPTSVLETGYDILFFWIARMVLMTTYALGEVPFRTVYLHGLVRDKEGRKMSKSIGNVIDPVDMIDKYGADAVRLSLVIGTTPGNDIRLYEEKIAGYRNLVNKLWNISRYIITTTAASDTLPKANTLADRWILAEFEELKKAVTAYIVAYRFSVAGEVLYEFTWSKLADWYVEAAKIEKSKDAILRHILKELLVLWHPFTPFVTEYIWQLTGETTQLIGAHWPDAKETPEAREFETIQEIIISIRDLKQELKRFDAIPIIYHTTTHTNLAEAQRPLIEKLAGVSLTITANPAPADVLKRVMTSGTVSTTLTARADTARRESERAELQNYVIALRNRLTDKAFRSRAPAAIVTKEEERLRDAEERLQNLS